MRKKELELVYKLFEIYVELMDMIIALSGGGKSGLGYMLIVTYPKGRVQKDGLPIESLVSCRGDAVITAGTALGIIKEFVRNSKDKKKLTRLIAEASEEILSGTKKELQRG